MLVGILIGIGISIFIALILSAGAEQAKIVFWNGHVWRMVAGLPNRCLHELGLGGQKINGVEVRGCSHCDNLYVNANDVRTVRYNLHG